MQDKSDEVILAEREKAIEFAKKSLESLGEEFVIAATDENRPQNPKCLATASRRPCKRLSTRQRRNLPTAKLSRRLCSALIKPTKHLKQTEANRKCILAKSLTSIRRIPLYATNFGTTATITTTTKKNSCEGVLKISVAMQSV